MSASTAATDGWITRVLGVALPAAGANPLQALQARVTKAGASLKALPAPPAGAVDLLRGAIAALQAGNAQNCEAALARLEPLLQPAAATPNASTPAAAPARVSLVALGKARLAWRQDRAHAIGEIGRLQAALARDFADDAEQQGALKAAMKRLDQLMDRLDEEMADSLDEVLNAATPEAQADKVAAAKAVLARFAQFIATDDIMEDIDGNEVLPDMTVAAPLQKRLAEIGRILG